MRFNLGYYFRLAIRQMSRHKAYSLLNVLGLSLGMACAIGIYLFVDHHLSFDHYHRDIDHIYRFLTIVKIDSISRKEAFTPLGSGPLIQKNCPEVICTARLVPLEVEFMETLVKSEHTRDYESNLYWADPELFSILDIFFKKKGTGRLLAGRKALISQAIAQKYFKGEDPLGKKIQVTYYNFRAPGKDDYIFEVGAVVENPRINSHLNYSIFLPLSFLEEHTKGQFMIGAITYLKLSSWTDKRQLEAKLRRHFDYWSRGERKLLYKGQNVELSESPVLQKVRDIHLDFPYEDDIHIPITSFIPAVASLIGVLILFISCLNFINMSTARYSSRWLEVGVRKAVGAHQGQLILQFLCESLIVAFAAGIIALVLVEFFQPLYSQSLGQPCDIFRIFQMKMLFILGLLLVIVGIGAGSYPAFFLSSFLPAPSLKRRIKKRPKGSLLRKVLLVGKFSLSIFLIFCVLTIYKQIRFMKDQNLGFNQEQKIVLGFHTEQTRRYLFENLEKLKGAFKALPSVQSAAASSHIFGRLTSPVKLKRLVPEGEEYRDVLCVLVDQDFLSLHKIKLVIGKTFSQDMANLDYQPCIINEAALPLLHWQSGQEALGQELKLVYFRKPGRIVGICLNFHFQGLQNKIEPLIIIFKNQLLSFLTLKIASSRPEVTMAAIKKTWQYFFPEDPIRYFSLSRDFNQQYHSEEIIAQIVAISAFLGLTIASMG